MKRQSETSGTPGGERPTGDANAAGSAKRILVVDDDRSVRQMLARVLVGEGYAVQVAADGAEAVEMAVASRFDLVLLDLNMPLKSGWDTFEALTSRNPLMPIIVITARPNQVFTALGSGVGALLEKPLDFPKLVQTVSNLIAEPVALRLARMAGRPAQFHYLPPQQTEKADGTP